jgi:hypothetical protein
MQRMVWGQIPVHGQAQWLGAGRDRQPLVVVHTGGVAPAVTAEGGGENSHTHYSSSTAQAGRQVGQAGRQAGQRGSSNSNGTQQS